MEFSDIVKNGLLMTKQKKTKVFVALSGGVDSAVAALLLIHQGYDVTGVYMKNWSDPLADECPWEREAADARRVCQTLGIPFRIATFENQYRERVVNYLIRGYRDGLTPNPDVLCNREIKFKVFVEYALDAGAALVATGHYVRRVARKSARTVHYELHKAKDKNKDQSYFLALLTQSQIKHALFPVGIFTKQDVRHIAHAAGLHVAGKKDSQGICFIGKVKFSDFIREFIPPKPGPIVDTTGERVGTHDGLAYYTIGQRHGMNVGGGVPYYVVAKDKKARRLIVGAGSRHTALYSRELDMHSMHWIGTRLTLPHTVRARIRYRQPLQTCRLLRNGRRYHLSFTRSQRAITAGQFAVVYSGSRMLGGGVIA